MVNNNYLYGNQFDSKVVSDLKEIDKKLKEEKSKSEINSEEVLRLRLQKLYRGMELNNGIGFNNNRRGIPY